MHTFTPNLSSQKTGERPWHVGILWNRDQRVAQPLIELLKQHPDNFIVGDNQPYSGKEYFYSSFEKKNIICVGKKNLFGKDLSSWTATGTVILSKCGFARQIRHRMAQKVTFLHNDDRSLHHSIWTNSKTTLND